MNSHFELLDLGADVRRAIVGADRLFERVTNPNGSAGPFKEITEGREEARIESDQNLPSRCVVLSGATLSGNALPGSVFSPLGGSVTYPSDPKALGKILR